MRYGRHACRGSGFLEVVGMTLAILVTLAMLSKGYIAKNAAREELNGAGFIESSAYAALADQAEQDEPLALPEGRWVHQIVEPENGNAGTVTLYLGKSGRMVMDLEIVDAQGESLLSGHANARFEVRGRVLQLSNVTGATGLLPGSGRLVLEEAGPDQVALLAEEAPEVIRFKPLPDEETRS